METLVQIAKRLGIKPNPEMTYAEYSKILAMMREALGHKCTSTHLYEVKKSVPQDFNLDQLRSNTNFFISNAIDGVTIHNQENNKIGSNPDETFLWHSSNDKKGNAIERFQIELQLDDPKMPECFKKLDAFIKKYHSGYKITSFDHSDRADSLNVYMHAPITPQIAKELCSIVRPYLREKHHDRLNGFPIKIAGKELKGIKYAAEPVIYKIMSQKDKERININILNEVSKLPKTFWDPLVGTALEDDSRKREFITGKYMASSAFRETESLGQLSASIQYLDWIYYLAGKEGKSPFQLGNQFGFPLDGSISSRVARKYVDKNIDIATVNAPEKSRLTEILSSSSHPTKIQTVPCKKKNGDTGIRFLDEKGKEMLTRWQLGKDDFLNVYPNGLNVQTTKLYDGTSLTTIRDPKVDGFINQKNGRVVRKGGDSAVLVKKMKELEMTGRTYGQVKKMIQDSRTVIPPTLSGVVR